MKLYTTTHKRFIAYTALQNGAHLFYSKSIHIVPEVGRK